jgi:thiosulfate reductase cytochrome b subunit
VPVVIVLLALVVLAARGIRASDAGMSFLARFPGTSALPVTAPVGFPAWVNWQHGLNAFFLLFIIRSGWQVRSRKRPAAFWVRKNSVLRTRNPPVRIGLNLWLHLSVDILWVLNGVVFYVLIFCTGQWMRLVPLRWDVFPNAISAALQYASLDWPVANGWANYNALQLLSYFAVVFLAAPLALVTGLRLSPGLAARFRPIDRVFPLRVARSIHFWVMVFFVAFIVVHVTLVLATGALRNLNHMYAARDDASWVGFSIFAASVIVMIVAWIAARPLALKRVAAMTGKVIG